MPKAHPIKLLPSREYLLACFVYDPLTGVLTWRVRPREHFRTEQGWKKTNTEWAGRPAGYITSEGYRWVKLNYVFFVAHRVIWKMMTGEEPPPSIDHKGEPDDNRWCQLREAAHGPQQWNQGPRKTNTTGQRGVYRATRGRPFMVQFMVNGKNCYFGKFDTYEEAAAVAKAALKRLHGEFFNQ